MIALRSPTVWAPSPYVGQIVALLHVLGAFGHEIGRLQTMPLPE